MVLLTAAGCASPPPVIELPQKAIVPDKSSKKIGETSLPIDLIDSEYEYRLGPGDIIELFGTSIPEINRKYVIGPDGRISVPGVGGMDLKKKTRTEAEHMIAALLDRDYRNPRVTVMVTEYNNNRIYVLGEVRKPGEFNFTGRPTLLGALSRAEGLTDSADMRACRVVRGKGILLEVNLYDLLEKGNRRLNLPLRPNDTVYVSANEENLFYVLGEVLRPGVFALGEKMDVVRAVAEAGGPTEDGVLSEVRVVRQINGEAEAYTIDFKSIVEGSIGSPTGPIRPGDIVYVPRKGLASFNYVLRQITPSLNMLFIGDAMRDIGK